MPVSIGFLKVGDNRTSYAYKCTIGLCPWGGVLGYGDTPAAALHTAAGIASDLQSVLSEHPALAAALPPGTGLALKGISAASKALQDGHTLDDVAKIVGPNTAKVVGKLLSLF